MTIRTNHVHGLVATVALLVTTSCATTESLYAEYDQTACQVKVVERDGEPEIARATEVKHGMPWTMAVYFEFDSGTLDAGNSRLLGDNIALLKKYPSLHVVLRGNADVRGSEVYNLRLAARRAQAVADYLMAGGIERDRLVLLSAGESSPLVDTGDRNDYALNRRVELMLTDAHRKPLVMASSPARPDRADGNSVADNTVTETEAPAGVGPTGE